MALAKGKKVGDKKKRPKRAAKKAAGMGLFDKMMASSGKPKKKKGAK